MIPLLLRMLCIIKVYSSMQVCREGGREGGREEGGMRGRGVLRVVYLSSFSIFTLYWKLAFLKFVNCLLKLQRENIMCASFHSC